MRTNQDQSLDSLMAGNDSFFLSKSLRWTSQYQSVGMFLFHFLHQMIPLLQYSQLAAIKESFDEPKSLCLCLKVNFYLLEVSFSAVFAPVSAEADPSLTQ